MDLDSKLQAALIFSLVLTLIPCICNAIVNTPRPSLVPGHFTTHPPFQKCLSNHLPTDQALFEIPRNLMSHNQSATFRLREKCATRLPHCMRPCPTPYVTFPIPLNATFQQDWVQFTPYGYFKYDEQYFSPDDICLNSISAEQIVLEVCPATCGAGVEEHKGEDSMSSISTDLTTVCVQKCCSIHKALNIKSDSCEYTNLSIPWTPSVYHSTQLCREKLTNLKLKYFQTQPDCDSFNKYFLKHVDGFPRVQFRLLVNGSVLLKDLGKANWKVLEVGSFCMDGVIEKGGYTGDHVLLLCGGTDVNGTAEGVLEDRLKISGIAYLVLLFLGVPFLSVTALIYVLVWNQQNIRGWNMFSHTLAMLLHYLAQGVANTVSRVFDSSQNASGVCKMVGIVNHYSVLASFCWLTVINYDLFSMFRNLQTTVGRSRGLKRFVVYMLLAWGLPFVTVLISVILDNIYGLYGDDIDCTTEIIVPLYGKTTCYITENAMPFYLYYPVGVLMTINLILACMTFRNMYYHDKSTNISGDNSRKSQHRRKFSVMAKLFVVMGLVWIFELFVWSFKKPNKTLPWYLVFPDVFNVFQAIAIFWLFACQDKILGQVENQYPRLTPITNLLRQISCSTKTRNQNNSGSAPGGVVTNQTVSLCSSNLKSLKA